MTAENTHEHNVLTAVLGILDVVLKPVVARTWVDAGPEQAMHLFRVAAGMPARMRAWLPLKCPPCTDCAMLDAGSW